MFLLQSVICLDVDLSGQVLEEEKDAKYLGVTVSDDLEWTKHINAITTKTNSKLSFLRRNLKGCPEKLRETAYFALVWSFLEYSATVWHPHQNTSYSISLCHYTVFILVSLTYLLRVLDGVHS